MSEAQTYTLYIGVGYFAFMFLYVLITYCRHRGRIQVRIQTAVEETIKWIKPEKDGKTLIMEKSKGKKTGWKATFTNKSLINAHGWFGRIKRTVEIMPDATECIEKDYGTKKESQPRWTKEDSKKYIDAKILDRAGEELKGTSGTIMWLVLFAVIGLYVFQYLIGSGRIRLG